MSLLSSLFSSSSSPQGAVVHDNSLTRLFGVNNAPVSSFCNTIPILQPSLISTTFGVSLISLFILVVYVVLYTRAPLQGRTGVETRLLTALVLGNLAYTLLAFEDWFNLHYQVILCNDYKNGLVNLYQVSELIENYKLERLLGKHVSFYSHVLTKYTGLASRQFVDTSTEGLKNIYSFLVEGTQEAWTVVSEWITAKA